MGSEVFFLIAVIVVFIIILLTLHKLVYGVFFLIVLLPLERVWVTRELGLNIKLAEWMGLICVIMFLGNFAMRPKKRMFIPQLLVPLFIFALLNVVFLLINLPHLLQYANPDDFNSPGFRSIKVVIWCIYCIFVAMAVSYAIKDKRDLRNVIGVLLWSTLLICTISLIAMVLNLLGVRFLPWALIGRKGYIGIKGTFTEPAYFSHYMSVILPVALLIFILRVYRLGLFFTVIGCFSLVLASYFSFSTTGLAGMTLMLFLIPFLIRRYHLTSASKAMRFTMAIAISIYIVFLVGALFGVNFVNVTIANYFDKVAGPESRWAARLMGLSMFQDHPLVGFGPGNWAWHAEQEYAQEIMKRTFIKPSWNCLYWEILVDLGLIGFSVFIWFFLSFFRQLSKAIWRTDDVFIRTLSVGFVVGFMALLGEYYVAFNFYRIYVWVFFGIAMATIRLSKEEGQKLEK